MSIITDDSSPSSLSEDAAVEALISGFDKGAPKAPKPAADDAADEDDDDQDLEADDGDEDGDEPEDADEADEDEDAEEGDEDEDEGTPPAVAKAADDAVIEVTIDGVTTEHTVASLKRLAGQEASLTRKSQEADVVGTRAAAALNAAIETALEDLEPYKDVDWLVLQNQIDPAEFEWHRANAAKAKGRYDKLVGAAGSVDEVLGARRQSVTADTAQEAIRELSDPTTGIAGWNEQVYGDIMAYGVSQGLPADDVKAISNAKVIKLLHKAMLYDRGAKAVAKKVQQSPEKVAKSARQSSAPDGKVAAIKKSTERLRSGRGSDDDAIAILAGRWR